MAAPPTDRVRELETLLAKIADAKNMQVNYDMWQSHGAEHASDDYRAEMERDFAQSSIDMRAARTALDTLVAATRTEAPGELAAWVDAHDAYLAAFLADGEADGTGADVATKERAQWAEVRAGTRAYVDGNGFYVTSNDERYRALFGIDRRTLERVG